MPRPPPTSKGEGLAGRGARFLRWAQGGERLSLLLLTFAGIAILGFSRLVGAVTSGATGTFDERILLFFRSSQDLSDPVGPIWVEELVRDLTTLGGNVFLFLLVAAVVGFLCLRGQRRAGLFLLASVLGGLVLSLGFKEIVQRPRPELVPHEQAVYMASFPSMHSVMSTTIFLTLAAIVGRMQKDRRIRIYFVGVGVTLAILVGLSRIYLGVHWPTDVIAGWVLGSGWTLLCLYVVRSLQRSRVVEPPQ